MNIVVRTFIIILSILVIVYLISKTIYLIFSLVISGIILYFLYKWYNIKYNKRD
jgi:hypothetical protein